MPAYIVKGEWRGVIEPDERGEQEKLFLANDNEDARYKARQIAKEERFTPKQLLRVTDTGNVEIPLRCNCNCCN